MNATRNRLTDYNTGSNKIMGNVLMLQEQETTSCV